jgi:hypothetical protein
MVYLNNLPHDCFTNDYFHTSLGIIRNIKKQLNDVNVYGRLRLTSSREEPVPIIIRSLEGYRGATDLYVSAAGDCARIEYMYSSYDLSIRMYYNSENKLVSVTATDRHGNICFYVYIEEETLTLFNVVLPLDELEEIIFQNDLVSEYSLDFLKEFV